MLDDVGIAILAGGLSRRMGTNKSLVMLAGKPIVQHVIDRLGQLGRPMLLISNAPPLYERFELPIFTDVYPQRGSLGGLYSALYYSPYPYTLCVACDMPFLNAALLRHLLGLRAGYDGVVPYVGGHYESLHAVYHRRCLQVLEERLAHDQLRLSDLYEPLNFRRVSEHEVSRFDPQRLSFINLNTPADLSRAERLVEGWAGGS